MVDFNKADEAKKTLEACLASMKKDGCWHDIDNLSERLSTEGLDLRSITDDEGSTLLMYFARYGKENAAGLLLKNLKKDDVVTYINVKDQRGDTALMKAVRAKDENDGIVKFLLENKADVSVKDSSGWTALMWAVFHEHRKMVDILLENGAAKTINVKGKQGDTAWTLANRNPEREMWVFLRRKVEDQKQRGLKEKAETDAKKKLKEWFASMKKDEGWHDIDNLSELLSTERLDLRDIKDDEGSTLLMSFARFGKKDAADLLLKELSKNCNEEEVVAYINAKDQRGDTALMKAVRAKDENDEIVELLLKGKADVNLPDKNGWTVLMHAAYSGKKEIANLLLKEKADVNAKDNYDNTALMKAVSSGDEGIVDLLLEKGADVKAENQGGYTALMFAKERISEGPQYINIAKKLEEALSADSAGLRIMEKSVAVPFGEGSTPTVGGDNLPPPKNGVGEGEGGDPTVTDEPQVPINGGTTVNKVGKLPVTQELGLAGESAEESKERKKREELLPKDLPKEAGKPENSADGSPEDGVAAKKKDGDETEAESGKKAEDVGESPVPILVVEGSLRKDVTDDQDEPTEIHGGGSDQGQAYTYWTFGLDVCKNRENANKKHIKPACFVLKGLDDVHEVLVTRTEAGSDEVCGNKYEVQFKCFGKEEQLKDINDKSVVISEGNPQAEDQNKRKMQIHFDISKDTDSDDGKKLAYEKAYTLMLHAVQSGITKFNLNKMTEAEVKMWGEVGAALKGQGRNLDFTFEDDQYKAWYDKYKEGFDKIRQFNEEFIKENPMERLDVENHDLGSDNGGGEGEGGTPPLPDSEKKKDEGESAANPDKEGGKDKGVKAFYCGVLSEIAKRFGKEYDLSDPKQKMKFDRKVVDSIGKRGARLSKKLDDDQKRMMNDIINTARGEVVELLKTLTDGHYKVGEFVDDVILKGEDGKYVPLMNKKLLGRYNNKKSDARE